MTFSIVARSAAGDALGVAVASKFLAVGSAVPAAAIDAGALATQSYANLAYRPEGIALLRAGNSAQLVVDTLTAADDKRAQRQLGVVDTHGGAASYTGADCHDWAGGRTGDGYAIQGNILAGEAVVAEMEKTWLAGDPSAPLARRLLDALYAGDAAGGDRRGRQSAALFVVSTDGGYGGATDVYADLRADDHPQPIDEVRRLLDLHDLYFAKPDPGTMRPLAGDLLVEVADLLTKLGHAPADGTDPGAVRAALWDWGGVENLEERIPAEPAIDPLVLRLLRERAG